jgi:hypothetical protein
MAVLEVPAGGTHRQKGFREHRNRSSVLVAVAVAVLVALVEVADLEAGCKHDPALSEVVISEEDKHDLESS